MTKAQFIFVVACTLSALACRSDETKTVPAVRTTGAVGTPVNASAASSSLQVSRAGASDTIMIAGSATDVGDRSTFTAFAIDGRIARIDEQSASGNEVKVTRAFTFDARERLAHMSEDKSQMMSNTNASPSEQQVHAVVDLDSTAVIKSSKRVDGVEKPMQSWDVDNARRHAQLLVALARPGIAKPIAPRP